MKKKKYFKPKSVAFTINTASLIANSDNLGFGGGSGEDNMSKRYTFAFDEDED